jgi:hypothetical protein
MGDWAWPSFRVLHESAVPPPLGRWFHEPRARRRSDDPPARSEPASLTFPARHLIDPCGAGGQRYGTVRLPCCAPPVTCERQLAVAGRHGLGWIHPRECETTTRSRRVRVPSAFACRAGRGRRRTPNRTPPSSCSRRTPVLDRLLCAALENLVIRATSWGPQTPSWGLQKGSGSRAQCKPADGEPAPSQSKQIRGRLVRRVL